MYFYFTFCNHNIYDLKLEIKGVIIFTFRCRKSLPLSFASFTIFLHLSRANQRLTEGAGLKLSSGGP